MKKKESARNRLFFIAQAELLARLLKQWLSFRWVDLFSFLFAAEQIQFAFILKNFIFRRMPLLI